MLGVSRGAVTRWENNTRTPDDETKGVIAKLLGVSIAYLMGEGGSSSSLPDEEREDRLTLIDESAQIRIPVLDINTAACAGGGNGLDYADFRFVDYVIVDRSNLGVIDDLHKPFGVRVEGDSMEGVNIPNGAVIVVNPAEETPPGEVALVAYKGKWSIKGLFPRADGSVDLLSTGGPTVHIEKESAEDPLWFRVIGKVVDVTLKLKPGRFF
jgi:phage repressor protein C with HTH and peptisase S24 domain